MSNPAHARRPESDATPELPEGARSSFPTASRRTLLRTAGLVALASGGAAALASCSTDTAAPAASAEPAPASSSAASPSAASSAPASAKASATSSAAAPSGPSVATSEVPVGGGFILPGADYVVTQPEKGTYKAFSKICTHQGCTVSHIADQQIICRCHSSHFSIKDGSVVSGPAKAPLPETKTTVSGSNVVTAT